MGKEEYYWRLIQDLNVWLSGLGAATMNLNARPDRLHCLLCGRGEGPRSSKEGAASPRAGDMFVIIEARQKDHVYNGQPVRLRSYSFICLHCGLWQTAVKKGAQEPLS